MSKLGLVIGVVLIVLTGLAVAVFDGLTSLRPHPASQNNADWATYNSQEFGIEFSYPRSYFIVERNTGDGHRARHQIMLVEDTPSNRDIVEGRLPAQAGGPATEGPPAITFDMYQNNLDGYTTESWIHGTNDSNFKLSAEGTLTQTTLGNAPALSYRWSGLYEGTTIAVAWPDWVYAYTVTYLNMGDQIIQDYVAIGKTVRFTE